MGPRNATKARAYLLVNASGICKIVFQDAHTTGKQHTMKIGVISDTHGVVLPNVHNAFSCVDLILHAGDIDTPDVLIELGAIAPVTAIRGNMDSPELFPHLQKQTEMLFEGVTAVLIHDSHRLRVPPEGLSMVICGHTHRKCWDPLGEHVCGIQTDPAAPRFILNPGCGGNRTTSPSVAILTINGAKASAEFVRL